jgi:hypothetical protein
VVEGEAILADPRLPARRTAAWAAGGAPGASAWAVHGGRLGKVAAVLSDAGDLYVGIVYADDGEASECLEAALVAAAAPAHEVAEGEA